MLWFDGSIRNAVDKVKSSGVFLLVFVQGEDNLSKQYESYLNEEMKFNLDICVALKIPYNSTALQQFKQIYISVPVPSIFLIQNNGIPLKIVSSEKVSDIHDAISNAVKKQKIKQEKKNVMPFNEKVASHPANENKEVTIKCTQHIKNIGRKLFDISEEELKRRLKEIRAFPKFLLIDSVDPPSFSKAPPRQQSARIQFHLPNNTMLSWEFPDLSTLGDVRAYLTEKMKLSPNFKLFKTYPKSALTSEDDNKTLAELSLSPSANLILVPVEDKKIQAKVTKLLVHRSFLSTVLNMLLTPLFTVFNFFKKHIFKIQKEDDETPRRFPSDTEMEKIVNKKTSTSNIHGFKLEEDTDTDSEHFGNGNTTQQRFKK